MVILVENGPHGVPQSDPKSEFARRLEYIRTKIVEDGNLKDSLRAFWLELVEDPEDAEFSYEAVRRYHYKTREPPLSYLNRVVEVFPQFRLAWLIGDEGPPTKEEHGEQLRRQYSIPDRPLLEAVTERHPWLTQLTIGVQQTFMDVLRGLELQVPGGRALDTLDTEDVREERLELADDLVFLVTLPFRAWGIPFPEILREQATVSMEIPGPGSDVNGVLREMLGALATAMSTQEMPGHGWDKRPNSTVASIRRAFDGGTLPDATSEVQERADRLQAALDERLADRREKLVEEGLSFGVPPVNPYSEEED